MTYTTDLLTVERLLDAEDFSAAARQSGLIFERGLRDIIRTLVSSPRDAEERNKILAGVTSAGQGKPESKMTLGELVGLMRTVDLLKMMMPRVSSGMKRVKWINWEQVVALRNAATHGDLVTAEDANILAIWAGQFVGDCELEGKDTAPTRIQKSPAKCPRCSMATDSLWHYCPTCGLGINVRCATCNRAIEPGWRICPYCETRVTAADLAEQKRAREEFRILCRGMWIDGVVNPVERDHLERLRLELGLTADEAHTIETEVAPHNLVAFVALLEGLLADGREVGDQERHYLTAKAKKYGVDEAIARQLERSFVDHHLRPRDQ